MTMMLFSLLLDSWLASMPLPFSWVNSTSESTRFFEQPMVTMLTLSFFNVLAFTPFQIWLQFSHFERTIRDTALGVSNIWGNVEERVGYLLEDKLFFEGINYWTCACGLLPAFESAVCASHAWACPVAMGVHF